MPFALADLLDHRRIELNLAAHNQSEAISEVVNLLARDGAITDRAQFLELVRRREAASTTLAENGVAFPHARTDMVDQLLLAIGRSLNGIPWPNETGRAHLIFLIAVPQNLISDYLVVIGTIARTTRDSALRTLLLHAETMQEFIATMLGAKSI
jgi:mannitol/fructose-specific phosphotransferase system IIA component (Ntr-type)